MRGFPETKLGWLRLLILPALLVAAALYFHLERVLTFELFHKQEGDVVFQSLPHGELTDAIEGITHSEFSHCGVLVFEEGSWWVAEAAATCKKTPLWEWIMHGRDFRVACYRSKSPFSAPKLKEQLAQFYGKGYDITFEEDDRRIYCSELVYKAFDRGCSLKLGEWKRLGNLDWQPFTEFIHKLDRQKLPLDRKLITPVDVSRSPSLELVYTTYSGT